MKRFAKYIITAIVTLGALITCGICAIRDVETVESVRSAYKLTSFEYVVTSPGFDQIIEMKNNTEAIKSVFPAHNFEPILVGKSSAKVDLLISDDMDSYQTGLFNEKLLLEGEFDKEKISLDKYAANALDVKIGDNVFITIKGTEYKFEVGAIYLTSTYYTFKEGVALIQNKADFAALFEKANGYDVAFIEPNDGTKCSEYLSNYKPLGLLMSEEDYINECLEKTQKPDHLTEDEFLDSLRLSYQNYKDAFLSEDYSYYVENKSAFMEDVEEQVKTRVKGVEQLILIASFAVVIIYLIINILFVVLADKKATIIAIKDGVKSYNKLMILYHSITPIIMAVVAFGAITISFYASLFLNQYWLTIILFSLPILVSVIVMPLTCKINYYKLDKTIKKNKKWR